MLIKCFYDQKRTENLLLESDTLDLYFDPDGRNFTFEKHNDFHLFSKGHGREIKNEMWGYYNGLKISVFGYEYTTGSKESLTAHKQTVLSVDTGNKNLPEFELRPENLFSKIGQIFGYQSIDFVSHPSFSKRYLLRGKDEGSIRKLFSHDILYFFKEHRGVFIESKNNVLLFYRHNTKYQSDEIRKFIEEGEEISKLFFYRETIGLNCFGDDSVLEINVGICPDCGANIEKNKERCRECDALLI